MRAAPIARLCAVTALFASSAVSFAADPVEGYWKTVDDETGDPKSYVHIWVEDGVAFGRIEKLIRKPDQDPDPVCDDCTGERLNQRIMGMTILWGLEKDGDTWDDGEILDPGNGKIYSAKITPVNGGQQLDVRGYLGISLIGRTQTWHRVDAIP